MRGIRRCRDYLYGEHRHPPQPSTYVRIQPLLGLFRLLSSFFSLQLPPCPRCYSIFGSIGMPGPLCPILKLPHSPLVSIYSLQNRLNLQLSSPKLQQSKKHTTAFSLFLAPLQLTKHVQLRRQQHCKFGFCYPTNPLRELTIKKSRGSGGYGDDNTSTGGYGVSL